MKQPNSKMAISMAKAVGMAKTNDRICYVYHREFDSDFHYKVSFVFYPDWIFKAYPGGRTQLRLAGQALLNDRERELTK